VIQTSLNPNLNPAAETEPGYGQLFAVLIRRFPWFLLVFLSSVAVAGVITSKTPATYKSSMQLLVEPNYQGKPQQGTGIENEFTDPNVQIDTATQLNLMRSSGLLQKAVDKLQAEFPGTTLGEIQGSLVLTQIKEKEDNVSTKIFQAEYTSTSPVKTQRVLDTIREVYLDYNKKQQDERLQKGLRNIREQLKKVGDEVTTSEANLQRFRRSQNLIDPETQAKVAQDALAGIQQERRTNAAQQQEAIARYNSLQQQLNRTPQNALVSSRLSQSSRYQGLLNEIQKTELALAQQRLTLTEEHPKVQKLVERTPEPEAIIATRSRTDFRWTSS
jgi:polysaccharide biosynthesis transport protein